MLQPVLHADTPDSDLTAALQLCDHGVGIKRQFALLQRRQLNLPHIEGRQRRPHMETFKTHTHKGCTHTQATPLTMQTLNFDTI